MATGKIKKHGLRVERADINIPAIPTKSYTNVGVAPPTLQTGETLVGWSIIGTDLALQITLVWSNNGYKLTVFNAYTGTSGAATAEVHWLIAY